VKLCRNCGAPILSPGVQCPYCFREHGYHAFKRKDFVELMVASVPPEVLAGWVTTNTAKTDRLYYMGKEVAFL